jgi:hypothetical protein
MGVILHLLPLSRTSLCVTPFVSTTAGKAYFATGVHACCSGLNDSDAEPVKMDRLPNAAANQLHPGSKEKENKTIAQGMKDKDVLLPDTRHSQISFVSLKQTQYLFLNLILCRRRFLSETIQMLTTEMWVPACLQKMLCGNMHTNCLITWMNLFC